MYVYIYIYTYIYICICTYIHAYGMVQNERLWHNLRPFVGASHHHKVDSKSSIIHSEWCLCPGTWVSKPAAEAVMMKCLSPDRSDPATPNFLRCHLILKWCDPPTKQPFGVDYIIRGLKVLHLFLFESCGNARPSFISQVWDCLETWKLKVVKETVMHWRE